MEVKDGSLKLVNSRELPIKVQIESANNAAGWGELYKQEPKPENASKKQTILKVRELSHLENNGKFVSNVITTVTEEQSSKS